MNEKNEEKNKIKREKKILEENNHVLENLFKTKFQDEENNLLDSEKNKAENMKKKIQNEEIIFLKIELENSIKQIENIQINYEELENNYLNQKVTIEENQEIINELKKNLSETRFKYQIIKEVKFFL